MGIKENAAVKLLQAYNDALEKTSAPYCAHKAFIDFVIDNKHLTYKYILFTAILSKATDPNINTLCLQKQSTLPGAYDARSVCHKVIVPFEMSTLNKVLGGSNEPFLNKPARFPELSKSNAVRSGNDQTILNSLCDNLPKLKSSEEAYSCLVYLLYKLIKLKEVQASLLNFTIPEDVNLPSKLMNFVDRALEKSYEGEVLTLMVAGVYHLLFTQTNMLVDVHPVNQCGASGREIRGGRAQGREAERAFRSPLRERCRPLYPPVAAWLGRPGRREAGPGIHVHGICHAGRPLFQGRFPALQGMYPAGVRPCRASRNRHDQGGR